MNRTFGNRSRACVFFAMCLLLNGLPIACSRAQQGQQAHEAPRTQPKPQTEKKVSAAKQAKPTRSNVVSAQNHAAVRAAVGKTTVIEGELSRTHISRSGNHFLNFGGAEFYAVCFREDAKKWGNGGPAKQYRSGDRLRVRGTVELYQGKPQIKLRLADQIETVPAAKDATAASGPTLKKFPLEKLDELTWLSPAGVRYAGKDPQGRTRLEHVLRHAADQPKRAGPHGVFDGGADGALATIDQAWKRIKSKKIKPRPQGATSAYTVEMGKRVGYLGGELGNRKGKPPLRKVFLVVRKGTSDVITAFPRD